MSGLVTTRVCAMCAQPYTYIEGKRGRRPATCSPECAELQVSFTRFRWALTKALPRLPESAMLALRRELWLLGNHMRRAGGWRMPGTRFYALTLRCGHSIEYKARSRRVDGVSVLDAAPATTRCPECRARVPVDHVVMREEEEPHG